MRFFNKILTLSLLLVISSQLFSQKDEYAFLQNMPDSLKADSLVRLSKKYRLNDFAKAFTVAKKALEVSLQVNDSAQTGNAYNCMGNAQHLMGNYEDALKNYLLAYTVFENIHSIKGLGSTCINLGVLNADKANHAEALKYYHKAADYSAKSGNRANTASVYNNIGIVFSDMGNIDSSLVYAFKALEIRKELRNEDVQQTLGTSYSNIAILYIKKKDYTSAEKYYMLSYSEDLASNDLNSLAKTLSNLGDFYFQKGDYKKSLNYLKAAEDTAKSIGLTPLLLDVYWNYFAVYKKIEKYKEGAEYLEKYALLKDSLDGVKNHEVLQEMQTRYETEKKEQQIDLLNKDNLLKEAQLNDEKLVRYFMFGFIAVIIMSSVFIYNAYRNKKRANELLKEKNTEIQRQRNLLGEKNKEILDSINYAKNLQDAILPQLSIVRKYLPNTFVFYKPKDIVAGDFYWFFSSGKNIFLAVADCTGHGVPGAMVSMVCANALNKAVKEQGLQDPGAILDEVKNLVVEAYSKSEMKDGMDISLARINKDDNGINVSWAGANNPLWYIKSGAFAEIKADKQPIGKFDYSKAFTTHKISLAPGDSLFFITDGYADQFGGPKGKKYKYAPLKEFLHRNSSLPFEEQEQLLDKEFKNWSAGHQQVDDVTVIGVRL